jgi:hypothetical protein
MWQGRDRGALGAARGAGAKVRVRAEGSGAGSGPGRRGPAPGGGTRRRVRAQAERPGAGRAASAGSGPENGQSSAVPSPDSLKCERFGAGFRSKADRGPWLEEAERRSLSADVSRRRRLHTLKRPSGEACPLTRPDQGGRTLSRGQAAKPVRSRVPTRGVAGCPEPSGTEPRPPATWTGEPLC